MTTNRSGGFGANEPLRGRRRRMRRAHIEEITRGDETK
jgi:hypothetical protein